MTRIRRPRLSELDRLRDIEWDAGQRFLAIGMPEIALDEPLSMAELQVYLEAGRVWVATDERDAPVAYLLSRLVDGCAHVEQVSAVRAAQSRGLGASLIDHVGADAARDGHTMITLTTFRDVPWNAPYYQRLGFRTLDPGAVGPELAALLEEERTRVPGDHPRVAMRRHITRPSAGG